MAFATNFVIFQVLWFAAVLGGAWGQPWAGPLVLLPVAAIHLWMTPRPAVEIRLVLAAALIGGVWDSVLVATGLLVYDGGQLAPAMAPLWIVSLWAGFAMTMNVSMRWMRDRRVLGALLGATVAPISFFGGARLGAVSMPDPVAAGAALAVGWSILMPLLLTLAARFDGWPADAPPKDDAAEDDGEVAS